MGYCLCIKMDDKNLLHIIEAARYAGFYAATGYISLRTVDSEEAAIAVAAALVQEYCNLFGLDFVGFKQWISEMYA